LTARVTVRAFLRNRVDQEAVRVLIDTVLVRLRARVRSW